jgi:glycosyltransferase involved in cell wall biosynthesis
MNVRFCPPFRPLKVCFITEPLHAGVGRFVGDAVAELARRGHEIHVIYSPVRVEPEFLAGLMRLTNVRCRAIPMPRAIRFADIRAFWAVQSYVRANGPFDIVHGCSSKGGGYARLLKLLRPGPVLYSPQAFVTMSPVVRGAKKLFYRVIEKSLALLTDRIVCASGAEAEHAQELGIAPRRLTVIANGTAVSNPPERDSIRAELGIAADHVVAGFVGRMEDQKAPERLIAAALSLLPKIPELRLLMIGDGPKRARLQTALESAGLGSRVLWLGAVDARRYFPAMDIFALTSLYEGFAYVLIEALQAALPIVTTPVGGALEAVIPGVNGIVVPHDAPLVLIEAIRMLAIDGDLRRRMGQESLSTSRRFSAVAMVDAMEALYLTLLPTASANALPAAVSLSAR